GIAPGRLRKRVGQVDPYLVIPLLAHVGTPARLSFRLQARTDTLCRGHLESLPQCMHWTGTFLDVIRFSEAFLDADVVLAECARRDHEGIAANLRNSDYRSVMRSGWIKVKCEGWKVANQHTAQSSSTLVVPNNTQAQGVVLE